MKLILAGPVQPGQESLHQVAPHLDGRTVIHVGEITGQAKIDLFAHARGLLMPIRWPEPFGMVMLEAMVCGTPVLAFPEGAATEIVTPGLTGFLVDDEEAMARAVARLPEIDPVRCRAWAIERCDARAVASSYEQVYRAAVRAHARHGRRSPAPADRPGQTPPAAGPMRRADHWPMRASSR